MQRLGDNKQHVASLAVNLVATLTTNYVRWMFLLVPSAHAMGCQEEIPPGEYRLCCAILSTHICVQKLENPTANVSTTMSSKMFMEPETDEVRWSVHVLQSL